MSRDKQAEDKLELNSTKIRITKNRFNGITGPAGEVYYNWEEHKLYDKEEWLETLT